jgi:cellulose biosynthesis protein BcsQ
MSTRPMRARGRRNVITLEQALAIAGTSIGVLGFILGGIDYLIRSWLQTRREQSIAALNAELARERAASKSLMSERDALASELKDAKSRHAEAAQALVREVSQNESLRGQLEDAKSCLAQLTGTKELLDRQQKSHDNRIKRALNLQGALWTQPVMNDTPRFVPRMQRKTPIVSMLNLKGGVGKTTLTANLAWALSSQGYRVLLIDLDLQGSLSSLFLHNERLTQLSNQESRLLQHFLAPATKSDASPKAKNLLDFAVPVPQLNKHCRLIATSDHLAYAELSQTVRWLLRVGDSTKSWNGRHDGRMLLRKALHRAGVYKRFDVVLMDCPPLLNLCCSNALAASDTILIPVTPSPKAIERVPALLGRVNEFLNTGVNPDLKVLGVVVNRTEGRSLSPREEDLFVNLPDECMAVYGQVIDRFDTVVQQRVAVQNTEDEFQAPPAGHPLRVTFEALSEEFVSRLKMGPPRFAPAKEDDVAVTGGAS